jgi:hypothetical protein
MLISYAKTTRKGRETKKEQDTSTLIRERWIAPKHMGQGSQEA